jgi:glyoxylase-like metal-dependent hydrolase (beta-lactamase superfamily II)
VDTGIGPGPIAMLGGIEGKLLDNMRSLGVPPESVDIVIHTHLHMDHVGWNISDGKPNFPNATYYGPQADYALFSENLDANPQMQQVLPLKELQKLETYEGEITLTSELTTLPTPGHTPGHHSILVNSGGEKLMICGDLCHHPAQVDRPEWSPAFDTDKTMSAETRRKVLDQLEADGHLAAFCHFPGDGFGRIARSGNRRIFQAS